jgi:serine/threonine-protein kinase RsbT
MVMTAPGNVFFQIKDMMDVAKARREGMTIAEQLGFNKPDATKIAVVISELGRNILLYAGTGSITVIAQTGRDKYIKIIAKDNGPGIPDIDLVLAGGHTTSNGMGLGVSGSKRLMDEFQITSEVGKGTLIQAVKRLR